VVRRINLVPVGERARTKTDVGMLLLIVAGVLALAGIAFSYYAFNNQLSSKQDELAQLQNENAQIMAQLASLAEFDALAQKTAETEALVQTVYVGRTLVSQVLGDISLVIPDNAWFTGLTVDAPVTTGPVDPAAPAAAGSTTGSVTIQGNTYSFEDVATFLVRMELVPGLIDINLSSAAAAAGVVDARKTVKSFGVGTGLVNTQDPTTPLPLTQVEVNGQ
jgi:Tfp pilus assembly protein PilN